MESTRVDRWLHAVRALKTRTAASEACRGGHVKVNGKAARPSTPLKPGDRVVVKGVRDLDLEVVRIIEKRVGASVAVGCYVDHTPPPPPKPERVPEPFQRDSGTGRPTKKERRQLDRLRGRR
ncbi:MAG: RNA-binding S4 domain-containing protein [Microthrixaceae bacterium]